MKTKKSHKTILVWLLLAVFITPIAVKTIHLYETIHHETSCSHSHSKSDHPTKHDCNSCSVCQFTLSSFTEVSFPIFCLKPVVLNTLISIPYQKKEYSSNFHYKHLRAPPAVV